MDLHEILLWIAGAIALWELAKKVFGTLDFVQRAARWLASFGDNPNTRLRDAEGRRHEELDHLKGLIASKPHVPNRFRFAIRTEDRDKKRPSERDPEG